MLMFFVSLIAFAAILVPLLARRYWMVLLAWVACSGVFVLVYWYSQLNSPYSEPDLRTVVFPALRDGLVYLIAASVLYAIKRLFVHSMPRKPT